MKIEIDTAEREGSVNNILIRFPNGLVLTTPGSLIFCGRDGKERILRKLRECVNDLEQLGVDFDGKHNLL